MTSNTSSSDFDSGRIAGSAMLMMISKAISHGCFLLIAVILARSLDRNDFGTFNQVWLVNKSLLFFFALGLPVSVYYFLPQLPQAKRKSFILQTLLSLTILSLPFSLAMYGLADPLAVYFNNPALAYHLRLFSIYPLVALPTVSTDAILIGLGRTKQAAIFEIATKTAMVAAVASAGILGQRLDLVFIGLVAYGVAQSLLGVWMVWQPVRGARARFSATDWQSQIAYAAPYGLATLAGALNYQVDKVLIALFYPPAVFALYAAGAFEIPLAGITSVPVLSVMMGALNKNFTLGDVDGFLQLWHQSMLKLALPVFAVTAFLMVVAEPVVIGLFSSEYSDAVWPFRIFLLFVPMRITVLEQVLASLGETKFVLKTQVGAMTINIVLGYALVQSTGWLGPAVAAVITGYGCSALLLLEIRRRLGVSFARLVPWRMLSQVALVAILAGGCYAAVTLMGSDSLWELSLGAAAFAVVYTIGNLQIRSITPGDLYILWGWMATAPGWLSRKQVFGSGTRK